MKKKGLLHQSFYKQKVQGQFASIIYGYEYFENHEITSLLRGAIKHIVKDGILPQNPYACLIRLLTINSVEDSLTTYFHNRSIQPLKIKSKGRKNDIEEVRIGQIVLYTSHEFGSQITPNEIDHVQNIIKSNRINLGNCEVYTSVCGTQLLKSSSLKYTNYSKNRICFRNYIDVGTKQNGAMDKFSKSVYNAIMEIMNSKEYIFEHLGFESFYSLYHAEEIWNRSQIILYKTKLFNRLCTFPFEAKQVFIKYYKKYNGEYFQIKQKFIPLVEVDDKIECPEALPLQSYFQGGFLSREGAQTYFNIYHQESNGQLNKLYLQQSSYWVNWHYHQQNIEQLSWSLYYHIIVSKIDTTGLLSDTLSSLLCSPISQISHFLKQISTLICLIQLKVSKKDIQSIFGSICLGIRQNLNQFYNAELCSIKDYILKLCQLCSSHSYFKDSKSTKSQQEYELQLIQILSKIKMMLTGTIHNYKQHLIGFNQSFTLFIKQIFEMNKQSPLKQFTVTSFNKFFQKKKKSKVIKIESQLPIVMEHFSVSENEARDILLINYYQQTKLKPNIYNFLLEICFEFKPTYPLPVLILRLMEYLFQYTYKQLVINNIKMMGKIKVSINTDKIQQAYIDNTNLYSLKGNLQNYAFSFVKIARYLNQIRIQGKGMNVIYSVSKKLLIQDLNSIKLHENTMSLDIDILIKGELEQSIELFYKVITQKLRQLQKKKNMGVIGYFNNSNLIKAFDLKNIITVQQFKTIISSSNSILVKCICKDSRIKVIELTFNLHYLVSEGWRHLKYIDKFWEYNRVFFDKKHLELWMQLYPGVINYVHKINQQDNILDINLALKKWIIQAGKDKIQKPFILQYYCERLYQLAQQSLNYSYIIEYIKTDRTGKFQFNNMQSNFKQYFKSLKQLITQYDYTYLQGIAISIDQFIKLINDYFNIHQNNNGEQTELLWLQQHFRKIYSYLSCSSQIIILYYRNYLKFQKQSAFIY